jgi:regulator of protease activity HflC (stomatin/prohibitin superfamily)
MDAVAAVILVALIGAAVLIAVVRLARLFERVVVYEYERGLRYDNGRFSGIVEPGAYRLLRRNSRIEKVDIRPETLAVPGQEVITSDGVSIRISLAAEYAIVDPAVAINKHQSYYSALYLALQVALREIAIATEIDDLLEQRGTIGRRIEELARDEVSRLGLRLDSVEAKDLMFPGELKKAFAQVVTARKEGLAALERARGETAALRSLANAARSIEANPALLQLRILQQIGGTAGNTIVLGLPGSAQPLPLRAATDIEPGELPPSDE